MSIKSTKSLPLVPLFDTVTNISFWILYTLSLQLPNFLAFQVSVCLEDQSSESSELNTGVVQHCLVSVSGQKVTVTSSLVPISPILTTISEIFASKHKSEPNVVHFSNFVWPKIAGMKSSNNLSWAILLGNNRASFQEMPPM